MELFKKVWIKSEADLPKEDGDYIVHSKTYGWIGRANWKKFENANYPGYNQYLWLLNYDWYIQPVTIPTDEEIIDEASDYANNFDEKISYNIAYNAFKRAAKWFKDQIK